MDTPVMPTCLSFLRSTRGSSAHLFDSIAMGAHLLASMKQPSNVIAKPCSIAVQGVKLCNGSSLLFFRPLFSEIGFQNLCRFQIK